MRKMGGLRKYMPWTYATVLIGAIASAGVPGLPFLFQGRDHRGGAFVQDARRRLRVACGDGLRVVTAFYTFPPRVLRVSCKERFESHDHSRTSRLRWSPCRSCSCDSLVCAGWLVGPVLYGGYFGNSIEMAPAHSALREMAAEFHGVVPMMLHAVQTVRSG